MVNLATWIAALVAPLTWRVLAALGVGVLVFQGLDTAIEAGLNQAQFYWGEFGGTAAELVALSGINTALAIVAGGVMARVALIVMKRFIIK